MTYSEKYILATDTTFINSVKMALLVKAQNLIGDSDSTVRNFSQVVLADPNNVERAAILAFGLAAAIDATPEAAQADSIINLYLTGELFKSYAYTHFNKSIVNE